MEKQFLSQEEIDALLGRNNSQPEDENESLKSGPLSSEERDVLCEIGNISVGSSSTALSELLSQRVIIDTPTLSFTTFSKLQTEFDAPYIIVQVEYVSGVKGSNVFILKAADAAIIADLMMGGDGRNFSLEMDEIMLSAVSEAMNQMIGFAATSMSQMFGRTVEISPPQVSLVNVNADGKIDEIQLKGDIFVEELVVTSFHLQIGELLQSSLMLIMNIDNARGQIETLMSAMSASSDPASPDSDNYNDYEEVAYRDLAEPQMEPMQTLAEDRGVSFNRRVPTDDRSYSLNNHNLNLILDIPLHLSVLLGRTRQRIADVLKITQGSIVELDRLENEPVDILVNDIPIARGEVVVVKEYFGVRITNIISPENRIKSLSPR